MVAFEVPASRRRDSDRASRARGRARTAACRLVKPAKGALWRFFETPSAPLAVSRRRGMPRPESNRSVPVGGRGSGGGSFHFSVRSGSRAGGSCAAAAYDYISREGEYDDPDRDPATYTESDNMPGWAEDNPRDFWDAADLYERENGRLYVSADFALPRGLDDDEQEDLVRSFARELTSQERLPYSVAIHSGRDADGNEHNPHAHLMVSERKNDGIERSQGAVVSPFEQQASGTRRRAQEPHISRARMAGTRARTMGDVVERSARASRPLRTRRSPQLRAPGHRSGAGRALRTWRCRHGRPRSRPRRASRRPPAGLRKRNGWLTWSESWSSISSASTADVGGGGRGAMSQDGGEEKRDRKDRDRHDPDRSSHTFPGR